MLINPLEQYDLEKRQHLRKLREDILKYIANQYDHKKMMTFLNRVGVIGIDEKEKNVYIGIPNEFVLSQIKKIFYKTLKEAVVAVYNPHFNTKLVVYTDFQNNGKDMLVDLKKLLNIKEEKKAALQTSFQTPIKNELSSYFGILFDPAFRFDNFVNGANTKFAFSAANAAAKEPGKVYNPLFLYGNVGLGKTHLMQAIGNHIIENYPDKVVLYLPVNKLIDEIVSGVKSNKLEALIKKFDSVDVLLIDDVQFLADKERTQEIFHNIFNDFHIRKKQIILSSDRPPKELINIAPRLKSRFSLGLIADIQAPDYETRIAILQSKMMTKGEDFPFEYLSMIAKQVKDNVRELEGALNILITKKKLSGDDLNQDDVVQCLKTLGYSESPDLKMSQRASESNTRSIQNFANIVEMVASYYTLSINDIKSESRKKEITLARQLLMVIAKKYFGWTLEKIGDYFGGKNHASVIYAINNMERKIQNDTNIAHDYQVFTEWIEK